MAKRKKAKKATGEKVKPSEVMKMPSESVVRSVASDIAATRKSKGKLSKELAGIISEAKTKKGIHPGALKRVESWVAKAKATDRGLAAIATELTHIDYYRDVLGLDELLKKQGQMFARKEAGEAEPATQKTMAFSGPAARSVDKAEERAADGKPTIQ